ncbi:MAG: ankyrin repeat domain-containing protein [Yoonia sp.]|uniref:ankyrin repeat domain-containing protein n=1 Tax=Yoonia sp. TaxID=2212373 RepID=UPI003EF937C2
MFRVFCVAVTLASLMSCAPQPDCRNWRTYKFFVVASADDVAGCLAAGVDVGATDRDGGTVLHLAALGAKDPAVINILVDAGLDLGAGDKAGRTPLHWAALINETPAIFRALIAAGADVSARDMWGQTPLTQARLASNAAAISVLSRVAGAQ